MIEKYIIMPNYDECYFSVFEKESGAEQANFNSSAMANALCAKLNRLAALEAVCREIVEDHNSHEYGVAQKLKAVLEEV